MKRLSAFYKKVIHPIVMKVLDDLSRTVKSKEKRFSLLAIIFATPMIGCSNAAVAKLKESMVTSEYSYVRRDTVGRHLSVSVRFKRNKERPFMLLTGDRRFNTYGIIDWNRQEINERSSSCGIYSESHWYCMNTGVLATGEDFLEVVVHADTLRLSRGDSTWFFTKKE